MSTHQLSGRLLTASDNSHSLLVWVPGHGGRRLVIDDEDLSFTHKTAAPTSYKYSGLVFSSTFSTLPLTAQNSPHVLFSNGSLKVTIITEKRQRSAVVLSTG